jgi:hypothetical protein
MRSNISGRIRAAVGCAVMAGALAVAPQAGASPGDPFIPNPPMWCPGNDPSAFVASGYGGFCEGRTFPDGSRWNTYRVGFFWQPLRCIIPNGSPFPPMAPPGGCGGDW